MEKLQIEQCDQAIQGLEQLKDQIAIPFENLKSARYNQTDARFVFLGSVQAQIFSSLCLIKILHTGIACNPTRAHFAMLFQTDDTGYSIYELATMLGQKVLLITKVHSELEFFFKSVASFLHSSGKMTETPEIGYFKLIKQMAPIGNIAWPKGMDSLDLLSKLRNSFHNGTIYTPDRANPKNPHFNILGMEYEFRENEVISCASWTHLVACLSKCLQVFELFCSAPLIKCADHIPNPFAVKLQENRERRASELEKII